MDPSTTMYQARELVPEALIPLLAVLCLTGGVVSLAAFSVAEAVDSSRRGQELAMGVVSSIFLGFGTVFLLVSCGIYI
jgi:tellurite resistance protein TehA-like permease